jgi:hypothetical protein
VDKQLKIARDLDSGVSTLGRLYVDGTYVCETLEPPWRGNEPRRSCIPEGAYPVVFRQEPGSKYRYRHLHVLGVPGRSLILVHIGNTPADTLGCILPGMTRGRDFVGRSGEAFNKLMALLDGAEKMTLTIGR